MDYIVNIMHLPIYHHHGHRRGWHKWYHNRYTAFLYEFGEIQNVLSTHKGLFLSFCVEGSCLSIFSSAHSVRSWKCILHTYASGGRKKNSRRVIHSEAGEVGEKRCSPGPLPKSSATADFEGLKVIFKQLWLQDRTCTTTS